MNLIKDNVRFKPDFIALQLYPLELLFYLELALLDPIKQLN